MSLSLEAIASAVFASGGALLGYLFSRLPKPWWMLGYFLPLTLILIYRLALDIPALAFVPPASWMLMGLKKFAVLGFVATMVLTTPLSRLPKRRDRLVVVALMIVYVFINSVWPFLAPLFNRNQLEHLQTNFARDGVCRQTTDYTCGPAAAVTALRKLGLLADEGKIALLSRTSSSTGTPPDLLAEALQKEYAKDGLIVEYRPFKNIAELKRAGLTLAVIKFGFLVDHFVTVLDVTDREVIIGDPLEDLNKISRDEFLNKWRFTGVTLKRQ
jgi:hypothetical protein